MQHLNGFWQPPNLGGMKQIVVTSVSKGGAFLDELDELVYHNMHVMKSRAEDLGFNCHIIWSVTTDSPGKVLHKLASESQATQIVVGRRGLGRIKSLLLGSTSDYLVQHSPVETATFGDSSTQLSGSPHGMFFC